MSFKLHISVLVPSRQESAGFRGVEKTVELPFAPFIGLNLTLGRSNDEPQFPFGIRISELDYDLTTGLFDTTVQGPRITSEWLDLLVRFAGFEPANLQYVARRSALERARHLKLINPPEEQSLPLSPSEP